MLGPEALPPRPFLSLLNDYGSPWALEERTPALPGLLALRSHADTIWMPRSYRKNNMVAATMQ